MPHTFLQDNPEVTTLLEKFRIGNLSQEDVDENESSGTDDENPWAMVST